MSKETTKISDYTNRIQTSWHRTVDSILETASLCAEGNSSLSSSEKQQLIDHLPFGGSTFSKLATIGAQSKLLEKPIRQHLPASYTIMYEAALLSDEQLKGAIDDGLLSPEATRTDLERLRKGQAVGSAKAAPLFAYIKLPDDYTQDQRKALESELAKIGQKFHVRIDRPRSPEQRAFDQSYARLRAEIRSEAQHLVQKVKQSRLMGKGKLTKVQKKKKWPFADHEVRLEKDYTFDQIKTVLKRVGIEDEFERIQDLAFRMVAPPVISDFDEMAEGLRVTEDFLNHWHSIFDGVHSAGSE